MSYPPRVSPFFTDANTAGATQDQSACECYFYIRKLDMEFYGGYDYASFVLINRIQNIHHFCRHVSLYA